MASTDQCTIAAVEIDNLSKQFGNVDAVRDMNVRIYPGKLTGLVGPDGAGKTTLMRLMAGLMQPTQGSIRIFGHDTMQDAVNIPLLTGYMPQRFGLYEDLSVIENLHLYAELRGMDPTSHQDSFETLLGFTRLGPFTRRLAGQLSGGMKQKLGLACALMSGPKLLLLDEPGVGVDPVSRQDLWRMVHALTAEGVAVVWATAYLDEAERCDSVILLNEGCIAFEGQPNDLTATLDQRSFTLSNSTLDKRDILQQALDLRSICDGVIQGNAIRLVLRKEATTSEMEALVSAVGGDIKPVPPRFEDAFIDLLGGGPGGLSVLAERMAPLFIDSAPAVSCSQLTRRFGDFIAADHVSFSVKQGEIFGLLGPNGAGKSTTFKMLCGLLKPSSGVARVAGYDLRTATSAAKSQLGYMAQKFSLYGLLSVQQNLAFSAGVYGLTGAGKRTRIAEMVEIFHLQPYLKMSPDDLPLGYKQRLSLACAIMHQPSVLFLDEPTSGVDPVTRREFWNHINGMVRKGVTVLVTTHFMDEAEYCDRVALMYKSSVIALDTPDNLKQHAVTPDNRNPSMEDAFIHLIESADRQQPSQTAASAA